MKLTNRKKAPLSKQQRVNLVTDYLAKMSMVDIMKKYNISSAGIYYILKKMSDQQEEVK